MTMRAMLIKAAKEAKGKTSNMIFTSIKNHKEERTEKQIFKASPESRVVVLAKI